MAAAIAVLPTSHGLAGRHFSALTCKHAQVALTANSVIPTPTQHLPALVDRKLNNNYINIHINYTRL